MKIRSTQFTGYYIIASSLFLIVLSQEKEVIAVALFGILFGYLILKKKLYARRIVMLLSASAAFLSTIVLLGGILTNGKGVQYSLGFLIQITSPSLPIHILLGICFTLWFGIPFYILSRDNVKMKFNKYSNNILSEDTHSPHSSINH